MKRKKDWRLNQEERIINKRMKLLKDINPSYIEDVEPHRFSKTNPLGCGQPRCKLCHPEKYWQNKNHKDYHYYKTHPEDFDFGIDEQEIA